MSLQYLNICMFIFNFLKFKRKLSTSSMYHTQINSKFLIRWITGLYVKNKTSQSLKINKHALKMFILYLDTMFIYIFLHNYL